MDELVHVSSRGESEYFGDFPPKLLLLLESLDDSLDRGFDED